jgi:hypothetical protein
MWSVGFSFFSSFLEHLDELDDAAVANPCNSRRSQTA